MEHRSRPWIAIIVAVLLAIAAYVLWRMLQPGVPVQPGETPIIAPDISTVEDIAALTQNKPVPASASLESFPPLDEYEHVWNDKFAATTAIVLYSNMSNNFAKIMLPELKAYVQNPLNDAKLVFRHYPLEDSVYDREAAMMGECIRLQKDDATFWLYLEEILGRQDATLNTLVSVAADLEVDVEAALDCVEKETTWNYVLSHRQQAELRAGFRVSPSIIVFNSDTQDVRILEGANTMGYIESVIADTYATE